MIVISKCLMRVSNPQVQLDDRQLIPGFGPRRTRVTRQATQSDRNSGQILGQRGKNMFNRVIVPLDGSAPAEEALGPAIEFARLAGATLHLVRVVDTAWLSRYGIAGLPMAANAVDEILDADREDATAYLAEMRERLDATGIPVTVERREGRAADQIREAVLRGDLLAIATHGRSGISRLAMGSVAEDVSRRMETPVLLCRSHGKAQSANIDVEIHSDESVAAAWAH